MKKFLLALLVTMSALSITVSDAAAKRLGGGGSFGRQSPNITRQMQAWQIGDVRLQHVGLENADDLVHQLLSGMAGDRDATHPPTRGRSKLHGALRRNLPRRFGEHEPNGIHACSKRRGHGIRRRHAADFDFNHPYFPAFIKVRTIASGSECRISASPIKTAFAPAAL